MGGGERAERGISIGKMYRLLTGSRQVLEGSGHRNKEDGKRANSVRQAMIDESCVSGYVFRLLASLTEST